MALDRQAIERKDFPVGRRGYEPEAVDAHLARLADEVDALQRAAQQRSGAPLAATTSEQVRAILEAAEQGAQAITRDAQEEAAQVRTQAQEDARRFDADAVEHSRERVARVAEQAAAMLGRLDAIEREVTSLMDALRAGASRLHGELASLEETMRELTATSGAPPAAPRQEPSAPPAVEPPRAPVPPPAGDDVDVEGARLIALNMALNGQTREQTEQYLAENFALTDRDALLDEVYASVGGGA